MKIVGKNAFLQYSRGISSYKFGIWLLFFGVLLWKQSSYSFEDKMYDLTGEIEFTKNPDKLIKKLQLEFLFNDPQKLDTYENFLIVKLLELAREYSSQDFKRLKKSYGLSTDALKKEIIKYWILGQISTIVNRYDEYTQDRINDLFYMTSYEYEIEDNINSFSYENWIDSGYCMQKVISNTDDIKAMNLIRLNQKYSDGFARKQNISKELKKFIIENGTHKSKYFLILNPMDGTNTCALNIFDSFNIDQISNEFWSGKNIYSIKDTYYERLKNDDHYFLIQFNPTLTESELEILSKSEGNLIRYLVARHPKTSIKVLNLLSHDPCEIVRSQVARSPKVASLEIDHLTSDPIEMVRKALIKNSHLPSKIIELLINDPEKHNREYLASHKNITVNQLDKLSNDTYWAVQSTVAKNTKTNLETLRKLSFHKEYYVRARVAENPNIDLEIINRLFTDKIKRVREQLTENPSTPNNILQKFKNTKSVSLKYHILAHKNSNNELIDTIVSNTTNEHLLRALRNIVNYKKQCSLYLLEKLSKYEDEKIQEIVARIFSAQHVLKF